MANEIQFLLYNMPEEEGKVQVIIKDDTIWCTQKAMAQLFGVGVPAISKHLKNIFERVKAIAGSDIKINEKIKEYLPEWKKKCAWLKAFAFIPEYAVFELTPGSFPTFPDNAEITS